MAHKYIILNECAENLWKCMVIAWELCWPQLLTEIGQRAHGKQRRQYRKNRTETSDIAID